MEVAGFFAELRLERTSYPEETSRVPGWRDA
jgi:hypothetical protein